MKLKTLLYSKDYVAEINYPGTKALLIWDKGNIKIVNKKSNREIFNDEIIEEVKLRFWDEINDNKSIFQKFNIEGVLTYLDYKKHTYYSKQNKSNTRELYFMLTDILLIGNEDTTDWNWLQRRVELETICDFAGWNFNDDSVIKLSIHFNMSKLKRKIYELQLNKNGTIFTHIKSTYNNPKKYIIGKEEQNE